ncbi:putative aminoacrylate hydrolase RutD [compost metagenome]
MDEQTFAAFRAGCASDAAATLKRFAMLCAQGCSEARALGRQLHLLADADALVPAEAAEALLALLPAGEVDLLEGSGHACVLEQPKTLAALLAEFVREAGDD